MIPIPLILIGLVIGGSLLAGASSNIKKIIDPELDYSTKNKNYSNDIYKSKAKQIIDIVKSEFSILTSKKNETLKNVYNVFFGTDKPCLNKDDVLAVLNNIKFTYKAFWSTFLERNFFEEIKANYSANLENYKKLKQKFDSYEVYGL